MIHGESGAHGGFIQPYCLLSIGLHQAPAGIAVGLCDVDVMEGKAFNTNVLSRCLAASVSTTITGSGSTCAG